MRWSEFRRGLPERAGAGYGLYDEAYEKDAGTWVKRTGWRIWHSAGGAFRAEDDQGALQWIVHSDESSYFGFEDGSPWRAGGNEEEGGWFVQEPLKSALSMLRPRYLDDSMELRGSSFEVDSEVAGMRVLRVTFPNPMHAMTMTIDLGWASSAA